MPSSLVEPIVPKANTEGMDNFFKGFAMVSQINRQKAQQERLLEKMELDRQEAIVKAEQDRREYSLKAEGLNLRAQRIDDQYEIGKASISAREAAQQFKEGRTKEQLDAETSLMNRVNALGVSKHTQEWRDQVNDALLDFPDAARTPTYLNLQGTIKRGKDPTFRTQQLSFDTRIENLGVSKKLLYTALEHPNNPELVTTDPNTPDSVFLYTGKRDVEVPDPKNPSQKIVAQEKVYVPVKKETFTQLQKHYSDLYGQSTTGRAAPKPQLDEATARRIYKAIESAEPNLSAKEIAAKATLKAQESGFDIGE